MALIAEAGEVHFVLVFECICSDDTLRAKVHCAEELRKVAPILPLLGLLIVHEEGAAARRCTHAKNVVNPHGVVLRRDPMHCLGPVKLAIDIRMEVRPLTLGDVKLA